MRVHIFYVLRFSDDNEIKIEELEKKFSPKRKKDANAIEGYDKKQFYSIFKNNRKLKSTLCNSISHNRVNTRGVL